MSRWDSFVNAVCLWLCRTFLSRFRVIPHAEDPEQPLLMQFLLWHNDRRSYYLQHFLSPESTEWYHRHRWGCMRSLVLSGLFCEYRPLTNEHIVHFRFETYTMTRDVIHHVRMWSDKCWTLFVTEDATDDWGYYPAGPLVLGNFVPWREHVKRRVVNLETGVVTK